MDITTYKVCKNLVNNVLINGGGADLSDYAKKNHAHTEYTTEQDVKDIIEENGGTGGNVDLTGYVKEEQLDNYAEKDHTHAEYVTTDFAQQNLALKYELSDYAELYHTHAEYVTQDELANYAEKDHVHDKYTTVPAVIQLIEENCNGGTFDPTGAITEEDLEEYAKKEEVDDLLNNKLDKPAVDGTAGQILVLQDDGSLAYADNVGGGTVDLTEINNKLSELENNQIKKAYADHLSNPYASCVKIALCNYGTFSRILITDIYGGCILITGSLVDYSEYKPFKVVRLSNGAYDNHSPNYIYDGANKIRKVYLDGGYMYVELGSFIKIYLEGSFNSVETIDSVPTDATELPILDLTQGNSVDLTNVRKVFCDLNELNNAKGTNISLVVGEDNTEKIMNALEPNEEFINWFNNENAYNRFGIDLSMGNRLNSISIQKYHDNNGIVVAITNKGKILSRYLRSNVLSEWDYDATDLTSINTKLVQLETKQINKTSIVDMDPTPVCYKITPKDNNAFSKILIVDLYGGCLLITGSIIPDYKSLKAVRLSNGCWESYSASNNVANKIESVYYDGSYIYVNCLNYIKINFEGGFTNIEKIDSLPSNTTQIPILDLTQRNSVDLTDINDRLTQLENTTSGGNTNNDVYSTEEQAVGTWIDGKTLYRRTIEDNTLRETGTDFIKLFDYSTNMKIVKYEGVVTLNTNTGQTIIHSLPYYSEYSDEVYVTKTTLDTLRLDSHLTNFKLGGYIVSVYYYKV